ncbi:aminoglycoside adenylyltransferase domain-containing protein [Streptomyces sp. KL116D]|uniref:aminoglycoside adenylyltransferase domain-containing protein n=1 Tax=Streptomyces sp. KL116D TaxID=3045152 RepID=UPI0035573E1A
MGAATGTSGAGGAAGPPVSVRRVLPDLLTALAPPVGERLTGVWLYGSAVTGSFDRGVSDIDVLIGIEGELDLDTDGLAAAHAQVLRAHPGFRDRLDLTCAPAAALAGGLLHPLWVVSPGEPPHTARVAPRWALTRALVRETGLTLAGRPAREALAPADAGEVRLALVDSVAELRSRAPGVRHRGGHAYVVLTACRALRALTAGELADKGEAAAWTAERWPRLRPLLAAALVWRRTQAVRDETPLPAELVPLLGELLDLTAAAAVAEETHSERKHHRGTRDR